MTTDPQDDPGRPIDLTRPPRIVFGSGEVAMVGRWIRENGFTRILVVADGFNAARLDALGLEGRVTLFADVRPEPDVANLNALLALAESAEPQVVVGFGGGSAMDLAKLAAVLPGSGQSITEVVGAEKVAGKRAALVQVPTTSGTGSEAGTRALSDPHQQLTGLRAVDPEKIDLMRSLSASRLETYRIVKLPNAAPYIFAGLDMAVVYALLGTIVAEFLGAQQGMGVVITQAQAVTDVAGVFAALVILGAFGILLHGIVRGVERRVVHWGNRGGK